MANNSKHMVYFSGKIIETTVTDKALVADEWVRDVRSDLHSGQKIIVGLDCEWRPNFFSRSMSNKTATLQLCTGTDQMTKCLILQLFYMDSIPESIRSFLADPNITFVGVEVGDDASKLRDEYGLSCGRTADIQALAMARWPQRFFRKPGLKKLADELAGVKMEKPKHVCQSNWEARELNNKQIEYAAIDAYCSYRIGKRLLETNR
ncbi:hypothetical protein U1Q18_034458 [Sarracenia purpurea var. burkii]